MNKMRKLSGFDFIDIYGSVLVGASIACMFMWATGLDNRQYSFITAILIAIGTGVLKYITIRDRLANTNIFLVNVEPSVIDTIKPKLALIGRIEVFNESIRLVAVGSVEDIRQRVLKIDGCHSLTLQQE